MSEETDFKKNFSQLTATELADLIVNDNTSDAEKEQITIEMIKHIGLKVGALTLLTVTRYLKMTNVMKAIIEEDGELYKLELKKIADVTPDKGIRKHDSDISQSMSITVEEFE